MKKPDVVLIDLDYTLYDVKKKELYFDSIDFIKFLIQENETVLFTEGVIDFQKEKINTLNIKKYFGKNIQVYDSYSKMSESISKYKDKNVVLIDDNPGVLLEASKRGWTTIRVKRGRHVKDNVKSDYEVSNLSQIKNLGLFNV